MKRIDCKAWFSLHCNSSPTIVLDHRESCKTVIGGKLLGKGDFVTACLGTCEDNLW